MTENHEEQQPEGQENQIDEQEPVQAENQRKERREAIQSSEPLKELIKQIAKGWGVDSEDVIKAIGS